MNKLFISIQMKKACESRRGDKSRERNRSPFFDRIRSSFVRNLNSPAGHVRTVSQAFHVAFNQHLPCHSIGWQKRTRETEREREKKKREKRRTIVAARGDRRVSTFSNARRLVRSMARSGPAALFPVTGTMASNSWGRIKRFFL